MSKESKVANNTYLYVKSAPSVEVGEENCWYAEFVGGVLVVGGVFTKKFSEKGVKKHAKAIFDQGDEKGRKISKIERDLLNARNIDFDGLRTINRKDVNILTSSQYMHYRDKMHYGNKLDLGENEDSWLIEDPSFAKA